MASEKPAGALTPAPPTWHKASAIQSTRFGNGSMGRACNRKVDSCPRCIPAHSVRENYSRRSSYVGTTHKTIEERRDESTLVEHLRCGGVGPGRRSGECRRRSGSGEEERLLGLPLCREKSRRSRLAGRCQQVQRRRRRQSPSGRKSEEGRQGQLDRSDRRRPDAPVLAPRGGCGHREAGGLRAGSRQVISVFRGHAKANPRVGFCFFDIRPRPRPGGRAAGGGGGGGAGGGGRWI